MNEYQKDEVIKLYLRLKALRKNLPDGSFISERYVREYASIINNLSPWLGGSNISGFLIQELDLKRRVTSINYLTGEKQFSAEKFIEKSLLLSKLDAFCDYLKVKFGEIINEI